MSTKIPSCPRYSCGNPRPRCLILFSSFNPIAVFAKHLAILGHSRTSFFPWSDVVSFHFFQFEVLAAMHADAVLPFVCFAFLLFVKGAETEVAQVSAQHVAVDAGLLHYLVIFHQVVYLLFEGFRIIFIFTKFIILS